MPATSSIGQRRPGIKPGGVGTCPVGDRRDGQDFRTDRETGDHLIGDAEVVGDLALGIHIPGPVGPVVLPLRFEHEVVAKVPAIDGLLEERLAFEREFLASDLEFAIPGKANRVGHRIGELVFELQRTGPKLRDGAAGV